MIAPVSGLRSLASTYEVFLVDLWGVVHDGERPFDGVALALERLRESGARVLFLSNSSRTGDYLAGMLEKMGVGRDLFEAVVSSGDVTREALGSRDPAIFGALPADPRCLHVGDPTFVSWVFELGLDFVDDVSDADLVLATGTVKDDEALARVRDHLAPAAARSVPLVCTNPDRVVPMRTGTKLGPGAVAEAYRKLGAPVFLYGKPHAPIYAEVLRRVAQSASGSPALERVVAIGDLLDTDVRGARGAGIASVLVTGTGVHSLELGPAPEPDVLRRLCTRAGVSPDITLARFAW
jgi:HAD superfamily hydrolase (TIGR01459 family)